MSMPSGNVAFLFTDIEGSTRLLRSLGEAFPPVLEEHRAILRSAIAAHSGYEVSSKSDAFFVAFADPACAAEAALDAQLALQRHSWNGTDRVWVRMGIHTGQAIPIDGDYVSLAVNQAARVSEAANGGQILLSADAVRAVDGRLRGESRLTDLGPYRLKDIDHPVRLFQLGHPDLEARAIPLRATPVMSNNLPRPRTSFEGRQADLDAIAKLVTDSSLVTILGPGGMGKTRTAIEAASLISEHFADGIWFLELAALTSEDDPVQALAAALKVRDDPGYRLEDLVLDRLSGHTLLIVDNCEHMIDRAAEFVDQVLGRRPNLKVLATSREPLRVPDEVIYRLSGLPIPSLVTQGSESLLDNDGARLFIARATKARPDLDVNGSSAAIASIVRQLQGVPLALELAAATLARFEPSELMEKMEGGDMPRGRGPRTSAERHRNLESTVAWSYELLGEEEQRTFRALSVFSDRFDLAAADAVCGAKDTEAILQDLVDRSLLELETDGVRLYHMLFLVRTFALETLRSLGEAEEIESRHLGWAMSIANELFDLPESEAVKHDGTLRRHLSDLKVAFHRSAHRDGEDEGRLKLAIAIAEVLLPLGVSHWKELRPILESALERGRDASDLAKGYALLKLGHLAWSEQRYTEAISRCEESINLAVHSGDKGLQARCMNTLGAVKRMLGRYDEAIAHFDEALELARSVNDPSIESYSLSHLGLTARIQGNFQKAAEWHVEGLRIARKIGHPALQASSLNRLGGVEYGRGNYDAAIDFAEQALPIGRRIQHAPLIIHSLGNLGYAHWAKGDAHTGREYLVDAAAVTREYGGGVNAWIHTGLALCARSIGNLQEARGHLRRALTIALEARSDPEATEPLLETAILMNQMGHPEASQLAASGIARTKELKIKIDPPNARDLHDAFGEVVESSEGVMSFDKAIERALAFLTAGHEESPR